MSRHGFSLLEGVVALAVLGAVAAATLAAFAAQLRTSERAAAVLDAEALADDRLAHARLLARDDLAHLPDSLAAGRFDVPWARFTWALTTREVPDRPDIFDVSAVVRWDAGSYALATRLYRPHRIVANP